MSFAPGQVGFNSNDSKETARHDPPAMQSGMQELLEASGISIWEYDHTTGRVYWSPSFCSLLGIQPGQAPPDLPAWTGLIHRDDQEPVQACVAQAVNPGNPLCEIEYRLSTAAGRWIWIHSRGRIIRRDADGRPLLSAGTVLDVSARKHAELLLRTQHEFSGIVATQPDRDQLLRAILESALHLPELDGGGLYWKEPDGGYRLVAQRGFSETFLSEVSFRDKNSVQAEIIREGRLRCSCTPPRDFCTDPSLVQEASLAVEGIRSLVVLPIHVSGEPVACLNLASKQVAVLSIMTLSGLETLARQFTQALERLKAREEVLRQQNALRDEKEFSEQLIESLPGVFCLFDGAGRVIRSHNLSRVTGYSGEEISAMRAQDFVGEKDRARVQEALQRAREEGAVSLPVNMRLADGTEVPYYISGRRAVLGGRVFITGFGLDVSEQRETLHALESSQIHLKTLIETIPDLVWLKDPNGVYLNCNRAFERFFGAEEAEIAGKTDYDFMSAELAEFFRGNDRAAIAAGGPRINEEWLNFARDGYRGLFETIKTPMRDASGRLVGVLGIARDITSARAAQEALREREELHSVIFNQAAYGIEMVDAETLRFVEVNDTACRMLGYSREELLTLTLRTTQADPNFDELVTHTANVRNSGCARFETRHKRKDGVVLDVEISAQTVQLRGRDYFVAVWRDVGAEKAGQIALENEAEWRRALIENSRDGIAIFSADHRVIEVNHRFAEMMRYAPEEMLALHSWDVDAVMTEEDIRVGFADPLSVSITFETRHRRKDGTFYDAEVSVQGARIGRRDVFVTVVRDVSERKRAEIALKESEARFRAIADSVPVLIWMAGQDRECHFFNKTWLDFTGRTVDQEATNAWSHGLHPADLQQWQETYGRSFETRTPFSLQCRLRRHDGQYRWILNHGRPRYGHDGDFAGYIGSCVDITDRVEMESQLEESTRKAESANAAKSEFLAHMSHEIRTPLNGILGLTQVLSRDPLAASQRKLVERIQMAGQSLLAILNEILDFSRIEAGQLRIESRPFTLSATLSRVSSLLGETARAKGLELRVELPGTPLDDLVGDGLRLEQALDNLIGNAIKFTERGEVTLTVRQLEVTAQAVRLRFEIRDTGIGISPQILGHLFLPFTQAEAGITRRHGGTGLGLAISKKLVELMGGTIGAQSRTGEGSTFWFELPFQRGAKVMASIRPITESARAGTPRLPGIRVLIVDDSAINREVVERALETEGARTVLAADGQQAVQQLSARPDAFDAVLMDVRMPVLDGLEATRIIRENLGLTELPILALTAGVLAEQQATARAAGVNAVLAKPLDLEELTATLLRWVKTQPKAAREPWRASLCGGNLPDIPGIEWDEVPDVIRQDWAWFQRLLDSLLSEFTGTAEQTRLDLGQGEREKARKRLHTLRGSASYLGAVNVKESAAKIEDALRKDEPGVDVEAELDILERHLQALVAAAAPFRHSASARDFIVQAEQTEVSGVAPRAVDTALLLPRLKTLALMLDTGQGKARKASEDIERLLAGTELQEAYEPVALAVTRLDFETALEKLRKLARTRGWNWV